MKILKEEVGGNSERSQPTEETGDDAEARNVFWSMEGHFIYRHDVEPRVQLYVPKEGSFPIPLTYVDVTRTTHTNLDVLQEKHINVQRHVGVEFVRFTEFTWLNEHPTKERCGPWSTLQRFKQLPDLIICGLKICLTCREQPRKR